MFMTEDRLPYVEYLTKTLSISFSFIFRAPPLSHVSNIYYLPFNIVVWSCAIALVIGSTILTYIVYKFSKEDDANLTTSDFFLYAVTTVCKMDPHIIPKATSTKIATVKYFDIIHHTSPTQMCTVLLAPSLNQRQRPLAV